MATVSSEATSPDTKFGIQDISALHDALYPVSAKYNFFGLQIGVDINEIKKIEATYKEPGNCLLEILLSRLNQEPALTCADICKALRSQTLKMHQLANSFQSRFESQSIGDQNKVKNEIERECSKAEKVSESPIPLRMREKQRDESKNENIQSTELERQVHERDEPKSKQAKERACKKERAAKYRCDSEQPVSESAIQLRNKSDRSKRIDNVKSEDESRSDQNEKCIQKAVKQPEPDEYKEDERKQTKGKQKQKMQFSEMAASPQSGAESDQKRKKSVKEAEKIAPEIISTDSENESPDACKEKEMLLSKSEKTGKVRKSAAYSEVKHQLQPSKISKVKNEARKKGKIPEKEGSTEKQHSVLHRNTAVVVESDIDTSEQPSHKSKKKLEAEETESEESFSESTSDESENESPKHKGKVKLKSPTDTKEMYHDSDEEIEKVRAKGKKKMPQKSKVATAKSSPHSERQVEEEKYKQKKRNKNADMKEQERESELRAKASREKFQKPHSQLKERERVKETDSRMKEKRLEAHSSAEQASDVSETDCENEKSDSGNDSSEDGEDSEGKSSDEEEKRETDEVSSTAPSEEEVEKNKREEKSVFHDKEKGKKGRFEEERKLIEERVSKAAVEQSKYDSPQGRRLFDETHTRKVNGKRVSEAASLKYDSPGDDEQSDPGHGSRDQEEHDIQQKGRKKKKHRKESSMGPTTIGSSSPSTSQEKKKQPVSKKQGHRKKHVRKVKEKIERMKTGKEKAAHSSGDSSPQCYMTKNQYESDMKELVNILKRFQCNSEVKQLVNIFERFFGQICCVEFKPKDVAAKLQKKGLISIDAMKYMMRSPESQQEKIITLFDWIHENIKTCPNHLFVVIEVMLENEALQETAREILKETGTQCLVCELHFVLDNKTLFPVGRVCPVETAARFPSQVPPSDTAVPPTADTLSSNDKGKNSSYYSVSKLFFPYVQISDLFTSYSFSL